MLKPPRLKNKKKTSKTIFLVHIGGVIPSNANRITVTPEFHLDINADVNAVNQSFAFEYDFTKIENLLFKFKWMDSNNICRYEIYNYWFTNLEITGNIKNNVDTFIILSIKNVPVIFVNPTLEKKIINRDT